MAPEAADPARSAPLPAALGGKSKATATSGGEEGVKIHVRGIGVHEWDGTPDGTGMYEDKEQVALHVDL